MKKTGPIPPELLRKAKELIEVLETEAKDKAIDTFHIDLFLVPFPDLQAFRDALLEQLGLK